jgi:hypothetical protein
LPWAKIAGANSTANEKKDAVIQRRTDRGAVFIEIFLRRMLR